MSVTDEAPPDRVLNHVEHAALDQSEPSTAPILITEQEVLFGTAVAVPSRRRTAGRWFIDLRRRIFGQIFVVSTLEPRPRRRHHPSRANYLEHSRMAREMHRL